MEAARLSIANQSIPSTKGDARESNSCYKVHFVSRKQCFLAPNRSKADDPKDASVNNAT
ncbi:hypothetical protein RBSWK_04223 [Rhodopirellula baltica SWK14]|uniref:Uncharacterized protein n=1 Tax=Rhodopirellula baltica SWK14 TaxID=993516 RepID=L7CDK6_RHOBT|nr:hypothetical protein RBSWK_04223 [Rhodopirellula baltica SWK14]